MLPFEVCHNSHAIVACLMTSADSVCPILFNCSECCRNVMLWVENHTGVQNEFAILRHMHLPYYDTIESKLAPRL